MPAVGIATWAGVNAALAADEPRADPTPSVSVPDSEGRVSIPSIDVDAPLVPLELDPNGTLIPPSAFDVAGWMEAGPEPGEDGNVIVAGHLDSRTGPAVFADLPEARIGDEVHFDMGGHRSTYVVYRVETYPKDEVPDDVVHAPTDEPSLRLITGGGEFDRERGHYDDNVIVFAKRV